MNPHVVDGDSRKVKPFKFSDSFLTGFNSLITTYDKKIEDLNKVKSLIDKDAHHGVCNCSYKMRYIRPEDISTFISNLERAMENHLFKPHTSDCDLFAVESVKRFLQANGCVPFDAATIMGNPGANIPKGATLADLTFAAESECFNLLVYSKYELDKRVDCMREDIGKIQNMHFSAAAKSFVQKIPDIMNKKATFVMKDSLLAKALEVYIEDFIMFALRLNLCTVLQMLSYAVPRAAYKNEPSPVQSNESANNADNWDEDNDFFQQESVNTNDASAVYVVFTQGENLIGRSIRKATNSNYSHISISFDPSLDSMYSFSVTSFKKESIHDKSKVNLNIDVYGIFVEKNDKDSMQDVCSELITNIKKTRYDYSAFFKKLKGSDERKDDSKYKQICTTFVNSLFSMVGKPITSLKIPSPKEMREALITRPDEAIHVYSGISKDYKRKKSVDIMMEKSKDPKTRKFNEVVTECCTGFLKTNDYVITNKIPFNCNMRDVVLQDMHPQFKDTISALKFIMNDERSPVHQLVIQYYTEPIDDYDPDMIIKMFFGCPRHNHWDNPNSRDQLANDKANMNTDVNWLDKITYGNMFLDGNYRRDGLGNQHTHPIMNSFETIYKMFGGCDNLCDNDELSNSLIRISRVMKSIIERYCDGGLPNWEMCRDILSVFGEIFTRHMLRLYYNNNHYLVNTDQMRDTMIPGYMYAEQYILEADGFTTSSDNTKDVVKSALVTAKTGFGKMIGWLRDKLAKFMPQYFTNTIKGQCDWFNKNGKARYDEIVKAASGDKPQYHWPKKDKYYKYNVSFNPAGVDPKAIIGKYENEPEMTDEKIKQLKVELINVFPTAKEPDLASKIITDGDKPRTGESLTKAIQNAVLYSQIDEVPPETDVTFDQPRFEEAYKTLEYMCTPDQDGVSRGGKWSKDIANFAGALADAVKHLEANYPNVKNAGNNPPPADSEKKEDAKTTEGETTTKPEDAKKAENINKIYQAVSAVSSSFYTVSVNTIVKGVFADAYNNFKGVVNDFDSVKKGGSDSTGQQNANNANNS